MSPTDVFGIATTPPYFSTVRRASSMLSASIVMMGALLEETECLAPETAMSVLETKIKKTDLLELDRLALDSGRNFIDNQVRVGAVSQPDGFAYSKGDAFSPSA